VVLSIRMISEPCDNESSLVDFTDFEEDVEGVVELIHQMAYQELVSRSILSMWGWELRTRHMFESNRLEYIRDIMALPLGKVNRLIGCGYVTRKEVYEVFCIYHIKLKYWMPELHWEKMNYKF
jgi:hypothetical protein